MLSGEALMDAVIFAFVLLFCGFKLVYKQKNKNDGHNLMTSLFFNYILWWFVSNCYYISFGTKSTPMFSWLLFPEAIHQHIQAPLFFTIYLNRKLMKKTTIISLTLFFTVFIGIFISFYVFKLDENAFNYYTFVVAYFFVSFVFVQIGYIFLYKELVKRHKWDKMGRFVFWFAVFGLNVSFTVGFVLRGRFADNFIVAVISRMFDLHFFYSLGLLANYIDNKQLNEFRISSIMNPNESDDAGSDGSDHADDIESILDELAADDWSMENKLYILPKHYTFSNRILNLIMLILQTVFFIAHLVLYFVGIVVPLFAFWMLNGHIFVGPKFTDYYSLFMMKQVESLSLYRISDRGTLWGLRYYVITFGEGVAALILALKGDFDAKLGRFQKRVLLSNNSNFVGLDGGITSNDYDFALKQYMDPQQAHEFATRYTMHRVIYKWCNYYSLGQTHDTKIHKFVKEIHYNIDQYLVNNFVSHQIPNDLYSPLFQDVENKQITADDAFCYAISTFYYKLFRKRLSPNDLEVFKNGRKGLLSLGLVPTMIVSMFGNNLFGKSYWKMVNKFRELILIENKNHYITRMIITTAQKYGFKNNTEFNYCINSFCAELCPGTVGISGVLEVALNHLNENQMDLEAFKSDPEQFVLESLRMAGLPSSGRTVFHKKEEIKLNGKKVILNEGQSVIHTFDAINRCPFMFKNKPNTFNPKRKNLKTDVFVFGNKEEFIRNKSAKRACPLHNYAIIQIQELIARLYQLNNIELKYEDKVFLNSFEVNDCGSNKPSFPNSKVTEKYADIIQNSLDKYPRKLLVALRQSVKEWNMESNGNIPGFNDKLKYIDTQYPIKLEKETIFDGFNAVTLPKWDEDLERNGTKDFVLSLFSIGTIFPIIDDSKYFNNNQEMIKWRKLNVVIPKANVIWNELVSDHAMSLFAFASIGCLYTKKVTKKGKKAMYVNDFTFLHDYEVRDGLERYGAKAFFDNEYNINAVYVSCLDEMIYPTDNLWEFAKYVWKTSIFIGVTIMDHAGNVHMIESNGLVTATRENLPSNHPLRRLLSIFTYRTVSINYGLKASLLSQNALIERISGFTFDSIQQLVVDCYGMYEFKALHQRIDENMLNVPDEIFPINTDSKELYETMEYLVDEYLNVYYDEDEELVKDKYIISFYLSLCKLLKYTDNKLTRNSFVHLIASLMTSVTGYHELVGTVVDIAGANIKWLDTKIYKNKYDKLEQSKNDFALTSIVVMLTGLRCPSIINDFSHILIKDDKYEKAQNILEHWQTKLVKLSNNIDKRNKLRRIPFNSCNPKVLECSVSI